MKLGVMLPVFSNDASRVRRFAREAAERGFDGVFAADHLHVPGAPERPVLEAFAVLATVASENPELTTGTLVARVGVRHPAMLAKMAAATDDLSGSFVLGLGSGDAGSDEEDEASGLPRVGDRRALLAETVEALKDLFAGRGWEGGEHTPEIPGPLLPPPARAGGPPIWVGGASDELVRMAARQADGWNGWNLTPEVFVDKVTMLRSEAGERPLDVSWGGLAAVGVDETEALKLAEVRATRGLPPVWIGSAQDLTRFAGAIADAGATWFIVGPVMGDERISVIAEALAGLRS